MPKRFILKNKRGTQVVLSDFGATVLSVKTADRHGRFGEITLGYPRLSDYVGAKKGPYYGGSIGRVANRITKGRFTIQGKTHQLSVNAKGSCLHGGAVGFDKRLWTWKRVKGGLRFSLVSADGDQGFPGTLRAEATYRLGENNALHFEFKARCDQATHVNMTNHCYFNLKGRGKGDIKDHLVLINAARYTSANSKGIPTGRIAPLKPKLDFRRPKAIAGAHDQNYVLNKKGPAARAVEPKSGRVVELWTNQPGMQFYSGAKLPQPFAGFCFEPQQFPDSPNHKKFPSTLLKPGEIYRAKSKYQFSVQA